MAHNERVATPNRTRKAVKAVLAATAATAAFASPANAKQHSLTPGLRAVVEQAAPAVVVDRPSLCGDATKGTRMVVRPVKNKPDVLSLKIESDPLPQVCRGIGRKSISAVLARKNRQGDYVPLVQVEASTDSEDYTTTRTRSGMAAVVMSATAEVNDLDACDRPGQKYKLGFVTKLEQDSQAINVPQGLIEASPATGSETEALAIWGQEINPGLGITRMPSDIARSSEVFTPTC